MHPINSSVSTRRHFDKAKTVFENDELTLPISTIFNFWPFVRNYLIGLMQKRFTHAYLWITLVYIRVVSNCLWTINGNIGTSYDILFRMPAEKKTRAPISERITGSSNGLHPTIQNWLTKQTVLSTLFYFEQLFRSLWLRWNESR